MDSSQVGDPLVSIVICVYNGVPLLREALDSVFAQTYRNLEIVVVDDGSTDGTRELLQSYGARIRSIHQPNGGLPVARNTGVIAALGEFVALMDHDDLCEPERIAIEVRLMQKFPDVVLCSSDFSAFDNNGIIADSYCSAYYSRCAPDKGGIRARYPSAGLLDIGGCLPTKYGTGSDVSVPVYLGDVYDEIALGNFVHPPTILFRRETVVSHPLFDRDAGLMCDWDWFARAARLGAFAYIDRPLLRYRRSARQISSPRHWAQSSVDSFRVAVRVRDADSARYRRRKEDMDKLLADLVIDAAEANAERHPRTALTLLSRAAVFRKVPLGRLMRIAVKLVLPAVAIQGLRSLRSNVAHIRRE